MVRYLVVLVFIVTLVVAFFFLPVKIPYNVTVPGRTHPCREWTVIRDRDGNIEALLRDHVLGNVASYSAHRFERGDAVRLTMNPEFRPHVFLSEGDTVITIFSSQTERELAQLTGQLAAAQATLAFYRAGEKDALILEAQTLVTQARDLVMQQEREVRRLQTLREQDLTSQQELEQAETALEVLRADVDVAEARLEAVQTGAKPEQIELTQTEATAIEREIETLRNRLNSFTITSPIDGIVARSVGADTLLTVQDVSQLTILMPVPWEDHRLLNIGQTIDVQVNGLGPTTSAEIVLLGDTVHMLNGSQVLLVTALIEDVPPDMLAGAMITCTIHHGDFSLPQYVRHFLKLPF